MEEILRTIQEWWQSNVSLANLSGLLNTLYIFALSYIALRYKKRTNTITIDVNQSTQEVNRLQDKVVEQNKHIEVLSERLAVLTELLFVFANSTKINDTTKAQLAELYAKAKDGNVIEKVKETVTKVVEKTPEVIQEIQDVVEVAKKTAEPVEDLYKKLKESVKA